VFSARNNFDCPITRSIALRSLALAANTYEGMFLLDTTKVALNWDDAVNHVHDILKKHHSEIVASRQWDERRLAYPVRGHKKGTYLLTYFKTEGPALKDIAADCRLSELILRELILKVHPKLADQLVNQAMTSTPSVDGEDAPRDEEMEERPRRRRRDD
jgi:small subunit ribosomal protein S6